MKTAALWFIVLIGTFGLIILITGQSASPNFTYETTVNFSEGQALIWSIITDTDHYKDIKRNIISIDSEEYYNDQVSAWRENYPYDISVNYTILTKYNPDTLILQIKNNFTGMDTRLSFNLSVGDNNTNVNIKEESTINNIFFRGLKVLSGKESYVNAQIKWIRVGLYNYYIKK